MIDQEQLKKRRRKYKEQTERIKEGLSKIKSKFAVASGKGGVGKTTMAVNLATLLAKRNKVGLLDADITCPSVNKMLGLGTRKFKSHENKLVPMKKYEMKVVSMASIVDEGSPVIFKGPRLSSAVRQFLELPKWGKLDYLIADLPPSTGDIPLTIMQDMELDGIVIVTTPQEVSLQDARKVFNMSKKLEIPVVGIIENMAGKVFGEGGGKKLAEEFNTNFLGKVHLNRKIREFSDQGIPAVLKDEEIKEEFRKIVEGIETLR